MSFYVQDFIKLALKQNISSARKVWLNEIIEYIKVKIENNQEINLNFICTHNSRRSQFSQVWAKVAAEKFGIKINSYSGGVEVTAFNERAINSLDRFGFKLSSEGYENKKYTIEYNTGSEAIVTFSKLYDDPSNPSENFAAIMTCSHADENCPVVVGSELRIALRYEDPKRFDDSPLEQTMYDYRSFEIASELFYVFSMIK